MQEKKMSLMQLTFIVTVNMMGSGIIMLPANMAQVGAISLLSWIVTALGSLAIAYGFAQAGIFNQRNGGLAAYAEDAYGKDGYFQVFFLYFLSLAIANVAVASSALGYLSSFFPFLSSTPVMSCLSVIALLWLTTVANFGGPKLTGSIGSITVWGVILPVGFISFFGWFWFSGDTFAAAWNPKGISLLEGMGSSISLTLWAFLGMESASQNASAVENPKRNVPLACMFGTLGAAVVYILSTAVIQGIVPNADLAQSTGPFGLAFAKMFNPMVGQIVMALAAMACVGSLLGWQFTLATTAKDAADSRMFPAIFGKATAAGAPIAGMIVMGIVQSVMALSTISPDLSKQFAALVNLAVVTNVLPYIVALSALFVMMRDARVDTATLRRNGIVATIAILYSIYALWASGKDAVMGGMLVMAIGYLVWGFIAPRFASKVAGAPTAPAVSPRGAVAAAALIVGALLLSAFPDPAHAASGTFARIKESGRINFGYRTDARPFAYRDESGTPAGYGVALCARIADAAKAELALPALAVTWVPVTSADRVRAVTEGKVDVLCDGETETLARRKDVSFSIPIYAGGVSALLRSDAPSGLRDVLTRGRQASGVFWRASPAEILERQTFSVVNGTSAARWLPERAATLQIDAKVVPVDSYDAGVKRVLDRGSQVLFGDRAILQEAARRSASARDLVVLDRRFTFEKVALALARDDDDFRLLVDRTLSRAFRSADFKDVYGKWFGAPGDFAREFFQWNALPE
jgi:putrescine:ornithine antiporter